MIQANSLHELPMANATFNTTKLKKAVEWAFSDSGTTGDFVVDGPAVVNIRLVTHPIKIILPNIKIIISTHTCNLIISWLPGIMPEAHIVPGLAHLSLILTQTFCDTGCKVMFDEDNCRVYYEGKLVLTEGRDPVTEFWQLPTNPTAIRNISTPLNHLDLEKPANTLKVVM